MKDYRIFHLFEEDLISVVEEVRTIGKVLGVFRSTFLSTNPKEGESIIFRGF
jgi:hypothetical protein